MDWFLAGLYAALFLLIIWKTSFYRLEGIPDGMVLAAFAAKLLAATLLFLIYSRFYTNRATADIFKYYDDSKVMFDALFVRPLDYFQMLFGFRNDSPHFNAYYQQMNNWNGIYPSNIYGDGHIMIRFHALIRLVSFGSYHVHAVCMSFLSFTGIVGLYKVSRSYLADYKWDTFALFFFFPSILLWSSGVLKEGLIFFSMGVLIYHLDKSLKRSWTLPGIVLMIACLLVLRYSKFYLFALLIPLIISFVSAHYILPKKPWQLYLPVFLIFVLLGFLAGEIHPVYRVAEIISRKQNDFLLLAHEMASGSVMKVAPLKADLGVILTQVVPGFFRTLARPFPWEARNALMLAASLENVLIGMMILRSLFFLRKPAALSFFWFSLILFVSVFVLTGLITPVMGALVRYKTPALPFLFVCLMMVNRKPFLLRRRERNNSVHLFP